MKLKIDNVMAYGEFTEEQIDSIYNEMKKPKDKRLYIMGIEFSLVDKVEVIK